MLKHNVCIIHNAFRCLSIIHGSWKLFHLSRIYIQVVLKSEPQSPTYGNSAPWHSHVYGIKIKWVHVNFHRLSNVYHPGVEKGGCMRLQESTGYNMLAFWWSWWQWLLFPREWTPFFLPKYLVVFDLLFSRKNNSDRPPLSLLSLFLFKRRKLTYWAQKHPFFCIGAWINLHVNMSGSNLKNVKLNKIWILIKMEKRRHM